MPDNQAVLEVIAAELNVTVDTLWVDERGAVFYRTKDGSLLCACAIDTPYWLECAAKAATTQILTRLRAP